MPEALRTNIPTATGKYTNEDVDMLTAALHTPPPAISPSPTTAVHDRRFITLVGPPPAPQPPSTQAPSTTPSPSTTAPRAHLSAPTSQSRAVQQPPAAAQPDATRPDRSNNQRTSSSRMQTAAQSVTSSIQPSQSPEKQPDSAPTPVSAAGGLSRGAQAGIVIGSIALVVVLLGAVMIYYYKRRPLSNNIFTSRNKNLVPQRAISRPFPLDMSSVNPVQQAPSITPRLPPAVPAFTAAGKSYSPSDRPLPPIPSRQSRIGKSSSSYNRLP